eukprot:scaffold3540_cov147-Isochrysis_galbana.AAC.10
MKHHTTHTSRTESLCVCVGFSATHRAVAGGTRPCGMWSGSRTQRPSAGDHNPQPETIAITITDHIGDDIVT